MIQVLFEHGAFTAADTVWTAQALHLYLFGLMFAGVDFLLNYTFYARQDTRTPAIVGVIAVGVYFVVAWTLKGPLGFLGLVLADSTKQFAHAAIMTVLLLGTPARLHHQGILETLTKAAGAAILMGAAAALLVRWLPAVLPGRFIGELLLLLVIGIFCGALYLLALSILRVPEVQIVAAPARRLARRIKPRV
jgi:putative peptidoglycan lipid II flippase